jgi:hypothetical protein
VDEGSANFGRLGGAGFWHDGHLYRQFASPELAHFYKSSARALEMAVLLGYCRVYYRLHRVSHGCFFGMAKGSAGDCDQGDGRKYPLCPAARKAETAEFRPRTDNRDRILRSLRSFLMVAFQSASRSA